MPDGDILSIGDHFSLDTCSFIIYYTGTFLLILLMEQIMANKRTCEDFIQKAQAVHGNKYLYDKVEYLGNKVKVCITCPEHGDFWQVPNSHLRGVGCPACGRIKANQAETHTKEEFIRRAKLTHGDSYDYSLVDYINSQTKVKIMCPKHGAFWQTPAMHVNGRSCPICGRVSARKAKTRPADEFIARAKALHGDKFDYSQVDYVNSRTKVTIVCPIHGAFLQAPHKHLAGQGCRKCGFLRSSKEGGQND